MKISLINGSPRRHKSNSKCILDHLSSLLKEHELEHVFCSLESDYDKMDLSTCDAIVLAFPLYADSIPSSMLKFLIACEKRQCIKPGTRVYCVINNGFYEGDQNQIAIDQLKNWCRKISAIWGQGVGAGSGEMLKHTQSIPFGKGPKKNLGNALEKLAHNINTEHSAEDLYINPNIPRFMWLIQASVSWIVSTFEHKIRIKDLFEKRGQKK